MIYSPGALDKIMPSYAPQAHYAHFKHPRVRKALDYLYEKGQIGLIGDIILHTKKMSLHHRVRVTNIPIKIWEKIIEPELRTMVHIEHIDMFDSLNKGHCIDIGMDTRF